MKKFLKSPWTITVGSGLIILIVTLITETLTIENISNLLSNALNWAKNLLINILNFEVKVWWILLALVFLFSLLFIYLKVNSSKAEKEPNFLHYETDKIYNWNWKWSWAQNYKGGKYYINNLEPICPKCQTPLSYNYYNHTCLRCNYNTINQLPGLYDIEKIIIDNVNRNLYKKVGETDET